MNLSVVCTYEFNKTHPMSIKKEESRCFGSVDLRRYIHIIDFHGDI